MIERIGFCCKWVEVGKKGVDSVPELNTRTTTIRWLREHPAQAENKLWELVKHNIYATKKLVERVGALAPHLRMVRISSDMLPAYTEPNYAYFYRKADVISYCEKAFGEVGALARKLDVKLSMHPGQFCVLASDREEVVERSMEDFEYHATMAAWMGFAKQFHDFKINVHISGKAGPAGIRKAFSRLSPEARNCITIENEEVSYGLDDCLSLGDIIPIVLDIHHNWVHSGTYIQVDDPRIQRIIDSWQGVRPTLHYSTSREDYLVGHCANTLPDLTDLLAKGYKKAKLRAHSDLMWNKASNAWALTHSSWADIQVEAKHKNLASFALAKLKYTV